MPVIHCLRTPVSLKLWLSRETSVPIREQLGAQLLLGILSRKLAPGERLPSVREMARRLHIHANTVSAVYRDLAKQGWVTQRRGSGVFVAEKGDVRAFARACLEEGIARGFTREELIAAFAAVPDARSFLVIDPDAELARVIAAEIADALRVNVDYAGLDQAHRGLGNDTCVLINAARVSQVVDALHPSLYRSVALKSMQEVFADQQRPTRPVLVGIVSRSEAVLHWASTLLAAVGFDPESVVLRRAPCFDGLRACDIVAADVVTAGELPSDVQPVVFRVVSEAFIAELRQSVTAG